MNFEVEFRHLQGWRMMMSNLQRYQLHWVTSIISVLKTLKEMVVPLFILVFANGFNDTGKWYLDYLTFIIFGVSIVIFLVTGMIKWKRFVYWFEDDELRIESGLFVKKKRYIPFDRIQSLDYTEGILHRPFNLVKVKVETAGVGASLKAEAELTAITKEAAARIEQELAAAKRRKLAVDDEFAEADVQIENIVEPEAKVVFTLSGKDLFVLATTSGGIGLILSGAFLFISQFAEFLPMDWLYEEFAGIVKLGLVIVGIVILLGLLVVWGISVLMTFLAYYNFTASIDNEDIVITRGLIEKKRATIPLNRVQSVRVVENPVRQLFGYATVVIDNAGGGLGEGAKINLFPLVKKAKLAKPLKALFPELCLTEPTRKLPTRSKRFYYRVDFLWMVPVVGTCFYFFSFYGLLSIFIVPIVILWGIWQYRSAAFETFGHQLTMRFRGISLRTTYMMKRRIQSMEMKQNYFHRRRGVATVTATVKSGVVGFKAGIRHMEEADADRLLDWYEPIRKVEEEQ